MVNLDFYKDKTVLITGHTGFKGSRLCKILVNLGSNVVGYALAQNSEPNLFDLSGIESKIVSIEGDIRNFDKLYSVFLKYKPEIVIHMAAQPIVRESYENPRYTYETNVMGTVNVLECIRLTSSVKSFLNVTTDKVYLNNDQENHLFSEDDPLDGFDPYSNSKSCSELVTHAYQKSFFSNSLCSISTARAGNVIGGGDFSKDRIIPDCVRFSIANKEIIVRNPYSIRPYQHVLEPLFLYLNICEKQFNNRLYQGYFNVGPDKCDCITTGKLVDLFCKIWGGGAKRINKSDNGPHEASFLQLDNSKVKKVFQWQPNWHINDAIEEVCSWTKTYLEDKDDIPNYMDNIIISYLRTLK